MEPMNQEERHGASDMWRSMYMIDRLLQIITGIALVLAVYGIGILDDAPNLGLVLLMGCMVWFGILTYIANRKEERKE